MQRFSNILLVADALTDRSAALHHAVALAKNNQATLTVVGVVEDVSAEGSKAVPSVKLRDMLISEQREKLDDIVSSIVEADRFIKVSVLIGNPYIEIIRQVLRSNHDLLIKSADEDQSLRNLLFGSTDMHLMRKCPCPVWILKSTQQPHSRRILAALDHDPGDTVTERLNRQILEMSTSLALSEFSELHIVHAWRVPWESFLSPARTGMSDAEVDTMVAEKANDRHRWLEDLVKTYGAKGDKEALDYLKPRLHVIKGAATHIVPTTARELSVDLVIMGTVGRSGVPGFFIGNTAESILAQLDCSVVAVKPPGFPGPSTP